jgi:hypothetical protein
MVSKLEGTSSSSMIAKSVGIVWAAMISLFMTHEREIQSRRDWNLIDHAKRRTNWIYKEEWINVISDGRSDFEGLAGRADPALSSLSCWSSCFGSAPLKLAVSSLLVEEEELLRGSRDQPRLWSCNPYLKDLVWNHRRVDSGWPKRVAELLAGRFQWSRDGCPRFTFCHTRSDRRGAVFCLEC